MGPMRGPGCLRKDGSKGRTRGISAFIIETTSPVSPRRRSWTNWECGVSNTCELVFEDCEVPAENVLGKVNEGVKVLMSGLDYERAVLAGGPLGIMQACMDVVIPYIHERKQFDRPIGEFQLMQGKIADMYTTMNACRAYVYAVAAACDRGETARKDAAGAILYAGRKPPGWPWRQSRPWAVTAISTSFPPAASCAMRNCTKSAPVPVKSSACSSVANSSKNRPDCP